MEFLKFKRAVHAQFNQLAAGVDMLFLTNVDKDALWDCYLNSFPEEERQSHNCNNCKHYIRHYGRVVAIKDNKVVGEERLLEKENQRFRDVLNGNDGNLYAITDSGKLYKISKK